MPIDPGLEEYLMTAGIAVSALGLLASLFFGRDDIRKLFARLKGREILAAAAVALVFLLFELLLMKPTQLIFFDDAIYQSMAMDLIHMGQAWMCNYGTPSACFAGYGEIFHEPIGTSASLAMGFLLMGTSRQAAFATMLAIGTALVLLVFAGAYLLTGSAEKALFAELLMALSPVLLTWGQATNSDLPFAAYGMLAVVLTIAFIRKRSAPLLLSAAFAFALSAYMKVDAFLLLPILALAYFVLPQGKVAKNRITDLLAGNPYLFLGVVVAILAIFPQLLYAYGTYATGDFGAMGSVIQSTCAANQSMTISSTSNFGLGYFQYNFCGNVLFWADLFAGESIVQPVLFTVLALIGAAALLADDRRSLLFICAWFLAFFLLYTAFYAGSVVYGVDWRFMLSLAPQASILGGIGCAALVDIGERANRWIRGMLKKAGRARISLDWDIGDAAARRAAQAVLIAGIISAIYLQAGNIIVSPANITQAQNARYYENFVYADMAKVPASCLVLSYDPTLIRLNNRTSAQLGYIYNGVMQRMFYSEYPCVVVDYGYWCYTPDNLCLQLNGSFSLTPIATARAPYGDQRYGFYYIGNLTRQ